MQFVPPETNYDCSLLIEFSGIDVKENTSFQNQYNSSYLSESNIKFIIDTRYGCIDVSDLSNNLSY